jgi:hypothetical protein
MATKYIVDNLSGQTITGDLTINGNLSVTGVTTGNLASYRALLTQTSQQTATVLNGLIGGSFIIGETYTINVYEIGDDFSNIANVQSGTINQTGCVFIASGQTPTTWAFNSEIISSGNLVVTVLENNLGYNMTWENTSPGFYVGRNENTGYVYNNFNVIDTIVTSQITSPTGPIPINLGAGVSSVTVKDDSVYIATWDYLNGNPTNDALFYNPVQIQVKQNLDTTPIVLSGSVLPSFPFNYVSVGLNCNGNNVESFIGDSTTVNDTSEMINELNINPTTNYLGTYSDGGSGVVLLSMPTNLVEQFCSNGTLTFTVFAD